jgi:hypothetical protein
MIAPVWSVTVPRIRPKLACENSGKVNSKKMRIVPSTDVEVARAVLDVADFISITPVRRSNAKLSIAESANRPPIGET